VATIVAGCFGKRCADDEILAQMYINGTVRMEKPVIIIIIIIIIICDNNDKPSEQSPGRQWLR
jgi:hypothetical protein